MPDTIEIRRLKVTTHIGVPDEERAEPQDLWITIRLVPSQDFAHLGDSIENTIDYHQVATEMKLLAALKPRKLIETLAIDVANLLLREYPIAKVSVRIEKRILPDTDCVAVEIERSA